MVQRTGGNRRKSRHVMSKHVRDKGKISIRRYLQELKANEKVTLIAEPSIQKGLFHSRFYGKVGIIKNKQGKCYVVEINDNGSKKDLIVHPIHLRTLK